MASMRLHPPSIALPVVAGFLAVAAYAGTAGGPPAWTAVPPGGSSVRMLAAVPGSATVFAGTAYGGVFRSFDRGATWSPANEGLAGLDVRALAAGPAGSSTLYAGTESGLFQSDDAAASWHAVGIPLVSQNVAAEAQAFAIAPSAPATRYAAVTGTVYRSDDGGSSWTPLAALPALGAPSALAVDAGSPLHVYVGCAGPGTILISRTGGRSWRAVALPGVEQVLGLAADPARPGSVFAATSGGVFVTRNGGGHWSLAAGLPAGSFAAVGFGIDAPGTVHEHRLRRHLEARADRPAFQRHRRRSPAPAAGLCRRQPGRSAPWSARRRLLEGAAERPRRQLGRDAGDRSAARGAGLRAGAAQPAG
jgi:photosystem II stability/assembly factor-like uncharacterized protein